MPNRRKTYTPETHKHIAIDYDGTIVDDVSYPHVGTPIPGAIETIDAMLDKGYLINIWTCRGGAHESVDFIQEDAIRQQLDDLLTNELGKNIKINENFKFFTDKYAVGSPKISADVYIDNNAYGLETVNWAEIYEDFIGEKPEWGQEFIFRVVEPSLDGSMEIWDVPFSSATTYAGVWDVIEKNSGGKSITQMSLIHRSMEEKKDIVLVELVDRMEEK